jgi:DNA polymerase-3 subunit epsilon
VNPEKHFDFFNIQLTGITPQTVEDMPAFRELWTGIEPLTPQRTL